MRYFLVFNTILLAFLCLGQEEAANTTPLAYTVQAGDSLSLIAQRFATDVDTLVALNTIRNPDSLEIGQLLVLDARALAFPDPLPYPFLEVTLEPSLATTGRVQRITIQSDTNTLSLRYLGHNYPLQQLGNLWTGWIATSVLQPAGMAELELSADIDGNNYHLALPVRIQEFSYERERIRLSPEVSSLLSPETSREERIFMEDICSRYSPQQYWQNFRYPVETPFHTSDFGTLRAYNDGNYTSFHGGLDLRANEETPIYAPAAGMVSFAGALSIRGNTVIIDHGLGLCSGYMHLSHIDVLEGQEVSQGMQVGMGGATGLVTAAHLHWEMRLMGIIVNPNQWLQDDVLAE